MLRVTLTPNFQNVLGIHLLRRSATKIFSDDKLGIKVIIKLFSIASRLLQYTNSLQKNPYYTRMHKKPKFSTYNR